MSVGSEGEDHIEREILIDAPIERVWRLVGEPGWWIGDGDRFLTEHASGTLLRVVESGFASLAMPAEDRAAAIEDNIDGWEQQLGFAKRDAEHVSV